MLSDRREHLAGDTPALLIDFDHAEMKDENSESKDEDTNSKKRQTVVCS